jgi:hypothetical protein
VRRALSVARSQRAITTINDVENVLKVYSLEDIFHMNEVEECDVLYFLVQEEFVHLPTPRPL